MIKLILLLIVLLLLFFIYKSIEKFVNVNIVNDFYVDNLDLNDKNINASRICIFKRGPSSPTSSDLKIIDYECINTNEFLPILKLTDHRKKTICLDGNCLNKNDLQILNGKRNFKILNKSLHPSFKDKCLGGHANVKLRRCGNFTKVTAWSPWWPRYWYGQNIKSLNPQSCDTYSAYNYTLEKGFNSDKNLKREDYKLDQEPGQELSPIGYIDGHD